MSALARDQRGSRATGATLASAAGLALAAAITAGPVWDQRGVGAPGPDAIGTGRSLFHGQLPLQARLSGHTQPLPAGAVTCANCHRTQAGTPQVRAPGGRDTGPVLNATTLLARVERRGGPPSRYGREAFCRALRTGVDPAGVLLPRVMPRYAIDDRNCDALWRFLTTQGR